MSVRAADGWTNADLVSVLEISTQRIGVLIKAGRLPRPTKGLHDVKAVVRAYIRVLRSRESSVTRNSEMTRKLELDNELREVKLKRLSATLVPVERVEKDWFESSRRVRDALQNLPARLSGPFAAEGKQEKIFDLFSKEVQLVLLELSQREEPDGDTRTKTTLDAGPEPRPPHHVEGLLRRRGAQSRASGLSRPGRAASPQQKRGGHSEAVANRD